MASDRPGFFAELRRRHVWRVAVAYAVAAWLLVQVATQVFPFFDIPDWAVRLVVVVLAIGFVVAVVFAWVFELTPSGIRRTEPVDSPQAREVHANQAVGRKLNALIIAVLVLAVVLLLGNQFVWHRGMRATTSAPTASASVARGAATSAPATDSASVVPAPLPAATAAIPVKSVAVLPFTNESGKADEQYFSDGLSDDLITALSQFAGLKVISRNSAFQFRDSKDSSASIGRLLGVAHLLEGSVQRAGDEVRITATLVNAADGSILWSGRYDRPYKDLFALQDAITSSVADALKAKLLTTPGAVVQSDRPPGGDLAAYAAFQSGMAYYAEGSKQSLHQAIEEFAAAVRIDPHYARAYAAQARAWAAMGTIFYGGAVQQHAYSEARTAADKCLQLDPDLAAGYAARGWLEAYGEFDWTGARSDLQQALRLAPNDSDAKIQLGLLLATMGHAGPAVELTRQALTADPRSGSWYYLSEFLASLGRLDEAEQAIRTGIAVQPKGAANHVQLASIAIQRGDAAAALAAARQEPAPAWREIAVSMALQVGPDRAAADASLAKLVSGHAGDVAYQIAEVYALRRDPDNVFHWLDRAWANRDPGISGLLYDPFILRYRQDPRFAALCKKVGLPETTDAVAMK